MGQMGGADRVIAQQQMDGRCLEQSGYSIPSTDLTQVTLYCRPPVDWSVVVRSARNEGIIKGIG